METHLLKKRQIPYEEVSHCRIGGLFGQKIVGKNGKTLVKIHLSTVGPMAGLIRTFGKRPQS